jgi:hypothetical protein
MHAEEGPIGTASTRERSGQLGFAPEGKRVADWSS